MKDSKSLAARLQSAVDSLATPKGVQAEVRQDGKRLSVRLRRPGLLAVDTEATAKGCQEALRLAEQALAQYAAYPTPALSLPNADEYLPPLDRSAGEVLLTTNERDTCRVFALADWRTDNADEQRPRWAVCQPCPREQWSRLDRTEVIIYTELYTFGPGDDEPGATALVTHVGRLLVHDEQRGLFYATEWNNGESNMPSLAADDVQEVWHVVRFIPAAQA